MRIASSLLLVVLTWLMALGRAMAAGPDQESLCLMLEAAAKAHDLPVPFLVSVIWRESRFNPRAVGPKTRSGARAEGIAQFMPGTASEQGLSDPFDPLQALPKAAAFLERLRQQFGNLGLAAAAYNAGPARVQRWLAGTRQMPAQTRAYVQAVTGRKVEEWAKAGIPESANPSRDCNEVVASLQRAPAATFISEPKQTALLKSSVTELAAELSREHRPKESSNDTGRSAEGWAKAETLDTAIPSRNCNTVTASLRRAPPSSFLSELKQTSPSDSRRIQLVAGFSRERILREPSKDAGRNAEEWAKAGTLETASPSGDCNKVTVALRGAPPPLLLDEPKQHVQTALSKSWGIKLAAGFSREQVLKDYSKIMSNVAAVIGNHEPILTTAHRTGLRPLYNAWVGADSRELADEMCGKIRSSGGACVVLHL